MNEPTYILATVQTQAYRLLRQYVYGILAEFDLTPTLWSMLGAIGDAKEGIRQADVARQLHVKAPLVTMMVKELHSRDWIQAVPNQFDGRAKLLVLTSDGRRQVRIIEGQMHTQLSALLEGITDDEMTAYHKVLTTIIARCSQ